MRVHQLIALLLFCASPLLGCEATPTRDRENWLPSSGDAGALGEDDPVTPGDPCSVPPKCRLTDCGQLDDGCGGTYYCSCQGDAGRGSGSTDAGVRPDAGTSGGGGTTRRDAGTTRRDAGPTSGGGGGMTGGTCAGDSLEPSSNASPRTLMSLNDSTDDERVTAYPDLRLRGDQEDWYKVAITDGNDWGAPDITVNVDVTSGPKVQVEMFYLCNSGGSEVECAWYDPYNWLSESLEGAARGPGCRGSSDDEPNLYVDCDGSDESGVLFIRISPLEETAESECTNYGIRVAVE